ncbi:C40 family peptidase [Phaeodactylibacter luteus]|uniref:NlpC/P60 family protein n=1 Tax=Phaeodactylibacter luteus TaxID=1564516 RepID=A0A5C6S134_9BACT|nr:C40 family peptidase [Phaeodactylibacter luteus]TXB67590.1 NlpC/P60 family protein [Phaeodactylibacter luteus]
MRKPTALLLLLPLIFTQCQAPGTEEAPPAELSAFVDSLRLVYAPDKRVAIFNTTIAPAEGGGWEVTGETNFPEAREALLSGLQQMGHTGQISLLPETALEGKAHGVVSLTAANIRSNPKHAAELSTQALMGTPLRVYKKEGGWYLVQTPDGYLGWLDSGGFQLMSESEAEAFRSGEKAVFLPDFGFAYAAPGSQQVVTDLIAGNIVQQLGRAGGYLHIRLPDGREGYILADQGMGWDDWLESRSPTPENILATAERFTGRPYLWGGTSGKGVDCSGFTKTVFFLNGLMLPRDASQQVNSGVEVPTDTTFASLQPGDFLFFGRKATAQQPEKITHVAIYKGDGKIIHASGHVRTESLKRGAPSFNEYRLSSFVRAKRMLTSAPAEHGVLPVSQLSSY